MIHVTKTLRAIAVTAGAFIAPGIVYTLDWDNKAVVRHRLHWTHPVQASAAASALAQRTFEEQYEHWYSTILGIL